MQPNHKNAGSGRWRIPSSHLPFIYVIPWPGWPNKSPASVLTTMSAAGSQLPEQIALFVCVCQGSHRVDFSPLFCTNLIKQNRVPPATHHPSVPIETRRLVKKSSILLRNQRNLLATMSKSKFVLPANQSVSHPSIQSAILPATAWAWASEPGNQI